MTTPRLPLSALALLACGCALLSKADPSSFRYFTPELPDSPPGAASASPQMLRLGRVHGSANLKERIVYRDSSYEQGYYEDLRWTDRPEVFLRRALERTLFEDHRAARALSASAPMLEVELVAFEEVRAPAHVARLRAVFVLSDDRTVLGERTVTIERPIAGGKAEERPAAVAQALGAALAAAVQQIDEQVLVALQAREAKAAGP